MNALFYRHVSGAEHHQLLQMVNMDEVWYQDNGHDFSYLQTSPHLDRWHGRHVIFPVHDTFLSEWTMP